MSRDIYFKSEILDALRSVARASEGTERIALEHVDEDKWQVEILRIYRQGVNDALKAVAERFGLEVESQRRIE